MGCGKGGEQQAGWVVGKMARGFPDWMEHSNHLCPFPGVAVPSPLLWEGLFGHSSLVAEYLNRGPCGVPPAEDSLVPRRESLEAQLPGMPGRTQ